jgi:hypothetical protein
MLKSIAFNFYISYIFTYIHSSREYKLKGEADLDTGDPDYAVGSLDPENAKELFWK